MEDLNDVEFGSDKSTEEAPILIAQRYLNIFRQIHIFNKEKRNQFDDELLTLPQNVMDFFKRMPGGRLLVEHIEDVKTERGISFVKSNRDDFTDGDNSETSSGQNNGNMAIDASFAQTLAASMASVIKQAPAQAVSGGTDAAVLANLNKTFQLIAEEIKMSRDSMIEVLQETRQITNAVISSQLAISKLLENLCNGNARITDIQIKNIKTEEKAPLPPVNASNKPINQVVDNNINETTAEAFSGSNFGENVKKKKKKKKHNIPQENNIQDLTFSSNFQHQKAPEADLVTKSEKIAPAFSGVIRNAASKHNDDFANVRFDELSPEDLSVDNIEDIPAKNVQHSFTSEDTSFSSQSGFIPSVSEDFAKEQASETDIDAGIDSFVESALDFSRPTQSDILPELNKEAISEPVIEEEIDNFSDMDGLDFTLPQQSSPIEEQAARQEPTPIETFDNLPDTDGLDYSLPEQNTTFQEAEPGEDLAGGLDSLITDDGLDFALPEKNSAIEEEHEKASDFSSFRNDLSESDGLDFVLPEQNITDSLSDDFNGLDSLMNEDGTDFSLSEQNTTHEVSTEEPITFNGLDDLVDNSLETALHHEESISDADVLTGDLDDFIQQDARHSTEKQTQATPQTAYSPEQHSRYSEELDKIRAALTSDSIDVSSINEPIALDDYSDDENVSEDDDTDFGNISISAPNAQPTTEETPSNEEEWEWEYVDENGNPIEETEGEGEDWEWEYVEDDGQENEPDNNNK